MRMRNVCVSHILCASAAAVSMVYPGIAGTSALAAGTHRLALKQVGQRLYLLDGTHSVHLEGWAEKVIPRTGGWALTANPTGDGPYPAIRMLRHNREVAHLPVNDLREEWLKRDDVWGSVREAAQIRYYNEKGGGIEPFLYDAHPTPLGWLGVLKWRMTAPSGHPVILQQLVRVRARAPLVIEPARVLREPVSEAYTEIEPRLISFSGKLLLWEPGELVEVDPAGQRLRQFMRVRGLAVPRHFIAQRWLVTEDQTGKFPHGTRLDAIDLRTKTTRTLVAEPPMDNDNRETRIECSGDSPPSLLLDTHTIGSGKPSSHKLVSLDTGRSRPLRANWTERIICIWRGYLVAWNDAGWAVYDAASLKLIKQLPRPQRR